MNKNNNKLLIIAAVALLILIILVYFLSLGKINYFKEEEQRKRMKWIEERLNYLTSEITGKLELKKRLDIKVKNYFLYTRLLILILFILLNCLWCQYFCNIDYMSLSAFRPIDKQILRDTISTLLDFNQLLLLATFSILFIKFETLKEIKDLMKLIHLLVKRYVYRKHKGLESEIIEISLEIEKLDIEKKEIEAKLKNSN